MRRILYGLSLWVFLAGMALTIAALSHPAWITHSLPSGASISLGLHSRCTTSSSGVTECEPFPRSSECHGENRAFCSIWRSVGFAMNLTVVMELAALVGYVVTLVGGRDKREGGWKMVAGLSLAVVVCEIVAMAMVAFVNDHDSRFALGWALDTSTVLCTVSWIVLLCNSGGLLAAAYVLPPEDDYEQIP